jgi:23S rRNA (guanine2445-N2)-methyltransferase / 23S rRNA (guanine2069-N7)-methyltransferase
MQGQIPPLIQSIRANTMQLYTFTAACATGLERLVGEEIERLGGREIVVDGGLVRWQGYLESGYRSCLWSRFASRVFLELVQFEIADENSLYRQCLLLPWGGYFTVDTSFAVNCTLSGAPPVGHSQFAALRVKDAIVDYFRESTGKRPSVRKSQPEIQLHLHLADRQATLSLDLSGESLHRRGYRRETGTAPLKETLAAAIVALSGWSDEPGTLVDPMCGSATLLIEAALIFADAAPGLSRTYFGFRGWLGHDHNLWENLLNEAQQRQARGMAREWPQFVGYDFDPVALKAARLNIAAAGLGGRIVLQQQELAFLSPPDNNGLVLSNLPYGQRLSEEEIVARLYRAFGRILMERFHGWKCGVFIADAKLTDAFSLPWRGKLKLFNGSIPCRLLLATVPEQGSERFRWQIGAREEGGDSGDFADRLRKNLKKLLPWSEREGISCLRVYDRDLPEYNLAVDLYGKWVQVQEYAPPKNIDPDLAAQRLQAALRSIKTILGLRSDRVFLKRRERQKGRRQYEKQDDRRKMYEVEEGRCRFLVNFTDYLDTGLFLDHRPVRERIHQLAAGKRFLNLFGYTGTASVQAAMGGAAQTTTIDLSATYLQWARQNFALNGLGELRNSLERADCLVWLRTSGAVFDLIFIDPPTFSNTRNERRVFDVQRDHRELIDLAMARLEPGGLAIFSSNFKNFKLEEELCRRYQVKDISRQTVPLDFSRSTRIHRCWELRH